MAQDSASFTSLLPVRPRVWLVTGCSSGLGQHLARAILARGDQVIATARRLSDLDYLDVLEGGKDRAHRIRLDVTEPYEQICAEVDKCIEQVGGIDVLVNNAGFVVSGVFEELSDEELHRQFETNFFGAMKTTRCVLPHMRKAKSGVILFMGSISGWYGVGAGGPYSASKFAIEGAAECLSKEVSQLGIRVHIMVLGQFRTDILAETRKGGVLASTSLSSYDPIKAEMAARHRETHGKQPGDPKLAAKRLLDVVKLENLTESEIAAMPLRIPVGSDALDIIRSKCSQTLDSLVSWEAFARSTDFPDAEYVPSYQR